MRFHSKHAVVFSLAFLLIGSSIWAQESTPDRPTALLKQALTSLNLDGDKATVTQQVAAQEQIGAAKNGPTVSERLKAMRSRGVDTAIGKPFTVADPRAVGKETVKAVPKRALSPKRQLTTTVEQAEKKPGTGPTPAMQRAATLAKDTPIALDTKGTVREARGFTSIT